MVHRITVPSGWLGCGATLCVKLPRTLACALCEGGGCDACERAGAVSLRLPSAEPVEVRVVLPDQNASTGAPPRVVVLRIPNQGGPPAENEDLPHGHLLLRVQPGAAADPSVTLVTDPTSEEDSIPAAVERPALLLWFTLAVAIALVTWALL